jgi:hypothetical protein
LNFNKNNKEIMDNKSFAVALAAGSTGKFYKQGLIEKLNKYPWLTAAGLDSPFYTPSGREIRGIEHAGESNLLTFGTAKSHDVNWVKRPDFAREKGYAPVYDIVKDYGTILAKLDAFAQARKPKPVYNPYYTTYNTTTYGGPTVLYVAGQKVEVYDNFVKVGYNIIPRNASARTFSTYTPAQLETIRTVIVTIKYNY